METSHREPADVLYSWEMSTIGHPLADLCNLTFPFITANNETARKELQASAGSATTHDGFMPNKTPGLPTYQQCVDWYAETAGWKYEPAELSWGNAMTAYKAAVIMQGIGARYAVRQASSAKAKEHGEKMGPIGEVAYSLVQETKQAQKAKL